MKNVPKIPVIEAYISDREIKRALSMIGKGKGRWEVKVRVNIGYHHIIPALKRITSFLERRKKYDDDVLREGKSV